MAAARRAAASSTLTFRRVFFWPLIRAAVTATRIAYGVPMGGDLEFVDGSTLSHAIASRREY
jgi:recombinational DNA repair protein RecR